MKEMMTTGGQWHIKGSLLAGCNFDWGCPCNFNLRPPTGIARVPTSGTSMRAGWVMYPSMGSGSASPKLFPERSTRAKELASS